MNLIEDTTMNDTKKRALLGWCENDACGEPIYTGDRHTEDVSDSGSRYFYCVDCAIKPATPDQEWQREEN